MYNLALPSLYCHVDISCHNDCRITPYTEEGMYQYLKRRQFSFINAITNKPSLANKVLSLTWTHHCWLNISDEEKMWRALQLLVRVQKLDIHVNYQLYTATHFHEKGSWPTLPAMFPVATSIRIGGSMPYPYFRTLISSPETVVSLDLDNLQGFRQLKDGWSPDRYGWRKDMTMEELRFITDSSYCEETEDENGAPELRNGGPMRGHLKPFFGRFTLLKHLTIRTIGHEREHDRRWRVPIREWARYGEMADFLKSLAPTITSFVFEQGVEFDPGVRPSNASLRASANNNPQTGRPMDYTFIGSFSPILADENWPNLKKVSIRGVGGRVNSHTMGSGIWTPIDRLEGIEDGLRACLGHTGIELTWQKEAGRTFNLLDQSYLH